MLGSCCNSALTRVDLPAPEGATTMKRLPEEALTWGMSFLVNDGRRRLACHRLRLIGSCCSLIFYHFREYCYKTGCLRTVCVRSMEILVGVYFALRQRSSKPQAFESLQILNLFAHLFNQQFQLHRRIGQSFGCGLGA